MSSSNGLDTTTVLLLVLGAILVLPLLVMGLGLSGMMGYGGMMDHSAGTGGWWPVVGMIVPLAVVLLLLGGGYLILRESGGAGATGDPAMEELRMAYARGDLTDEEFEARRETLERDE